MDFNTSSLGIQAHNLLTAVAHLWALSFLACLVKPLRLGLVLTRVILQICRWSLMILSSTQAKVTPPSTSHFQLHPGEKARAQMEWAAVSGHTYRALQTLHHTSLSSPSPSLCLFVFPLLVLQTLRRPTGFIALKCLWRWKAGFWPKRKRSNYKTFCFEETPSLSVCVPIACTQWSWNHWVSLTMSFQFIFSIHCKLCPVFTNSRKQMLSDGWVSIGWILSLSKLTPPQRTKHKASNWKMGSREEILLWLHCGHLSYGSRFSTFLSLVLKSCSG